MYPFLSKECAKHKSSSKYDLTAVISHFGSVGGGHYIAYAKNCINNNWYEFNDSFVTEVSETTVANAEAYVLFYSLKDEKAEMFRKDIKHMLKSLNNAKDVTYISKEWYNRFDSCVQPGPICNYDVTCKHGGINMQSFPHIKELVRKIPKSIYKTLIKRFGGGPELMSLNLCHLCEETAKQKDYELETFTKLHEEYQREGETAQDVFQISMKWYDAWYAYVTGKKTEHPGRINNTELMDGNLSSCDKEDESYGLISQATWRFLHSQYGGGPEMIVRRNIVESERSSQSEDDEEEDIADPI